ncbi:hypothetical protein PN36_25570 [Candidatus Thiomargarita nelsonii]|uniref:Uncharacterized protein n=1 Tax=Candidatus Thiomargarita nelsonii TaxID=1003181 RepID=A0A0A6RSD6_9GAMM|nr:hypothetical protein PN36_25570 [Candidatus Thiomargarita nelsonii]
MYKTTEQATLTSKINANSTKKVSKVVPISESELMARIRAHRKVLDSLPDEFPLEPAYLRVGKP